VIEAIEKVQNNLRTKEFIADKNTKSPGALARVARALQFPLGPSALRGTSYDTEHLHKRYPVQIIMDKSGNALASALVGGPSKYGKPANGVSYTNGFYFGRNDQLVTGKHALKMLRREKKALDESGDIDIGVIKFGPRHFAQPEQVIAD